MTELFLHMSLIFFTVLTKYLKNNFVERDFLVPFYTVYLKSPAPYLFIVCLRPEIFLLLFYGGRNILEDALMESIEQQRNLLKNMTIASRDNC